jgi:Tol biopolymer transport system component
LESDSTATVSFLINVLAKLSVALADRYTLAREVGHGGMATVYLAQDLKHHRMVALKVLRPELAASLGPARFLHEIEIAAQLQHPHILPLLDSGEADGFLYYVMPYVEGDSLRERLTQKGELPISDAVRILAEIADALSHAHGRGVVHRDMKPENIMLSGRHPLVMDFGIAKAISRGGPILQVTTDGLALGTPAYMAPEQAAADPHLDQRVDIYALGVIGYELLTGSTPFTGASAQQILAAHMTQRPEPISTRRPSIPPGVASIIMKCLEKRPADRPQAAEEIVRALETIITPIGGTTPTGSRPVPLRSSAKSHRTFLVLAAAILVLALAGLLWRGRVPGIEPAIAQQLTFVGKIVQQQISPDGELLAYVERGDTFRLVVRDLTGGSIVPIALLRGESSSIRWSPDGSSILYIGGTPGKWVAELFPRLGGQSRALAVRGTYGAFSPDGLRLASWYENFEPGITLTTLATGAKQVIKLPQKYFFGDGDWAPHGRFIAVSSETHSQYSLWTFDVETGAAHEVVSDTVRFSSPRWSRDGDALYYLRNNNELCKLSITSQGVPRGTARVLQAGLAASDFSVTTDGRKLSYTKRQAHSNLWLATRSRKHLLFTTSQLTRGTTWKTPPRFSPDRRLIVFVQGEEDGDDQGDVFVLPIAGGAPRLVTSSAIAGSAPAWSKDGRQLAFIANVGGKRKLRTVALDGGEEHTYDKIQASNNLAWAPYDHILYQQIDNRNFVWLDPASGGQELLVSNDSVGWMFFPIPSPNGEKLAVFWNRRPRRGVYVISLRDSSQTPIGAPNQFPLGWSADGTSFYIEGDARRVHRVPLKGGEGVTVGTLPFENAGCDLSDQSSSLTLVCNVQESVSDVWTMEGFDRDRSGGTFR